MLRLAYRNLFQNKTRLAISVGGAALALMLILSLDAIMAGIERQVTAYIDYSGADIFVAQDGVRNMHMASSSLAASVASQVKAVPGVASVTPILYLTNVVDLGEARNLAYVIGLPPRPVVGGPWRVVAGKSAPSVGEAVIDRGVAEKSAWDWVTKSRFSARNSRWSGCLRARPRSSTRSPSFPGKISRKCGATAGR
jgi:putative ABC transport system permease protein